MTGLELWRVVVRPRAAVLGLLAMAVRERRRRIAAKSTFCLGLGPMVVRKRRATRLATVAFALGLAGGATRRLGAGRCRARLLALGALASTGRESVRAREAAEARARKAELKRLKVEARKFIKPEFDAPSAAKLADSMWSRPPGVAEDLSEALLQHSAKLREAFKKKPAAKAAKPKTAAAPLVTVLDAKSLKAAELALNMTDAGHRPKDRSAQAAERAAAEDAARAAAGQPLAAPKKARKLALDVILDSLNALDSRIMGRQVLALRSGWGGGSDEDGDQPAGEGGDDVGGAQEGGKSPETLRAEEEERERVAAIQEARAGAEAAATLLRAEACYDPGAVSRAQLQQLEPHQTFSSADIFMREVVAQVPLAQERLRFLAFPPAFEEAATRCDGLVQRLRACFVEVVESLKLPSLAHVILSLGVGLSGIPAEAFRITVLPTLKTVKNSENVTFLDMVVRCCLDSAPLILDLADDFPTLRAARTVELSIEDARAAVKEVAKEMATLEPLRRAADKGSAGLDQEAAARVLRRVADSKAVCDDLQEQLSLAESEMDSMYNRVAENPDSLSLAQLFGALKSFFDDLDSAIKKEDTRRTRAEAKRRHQEQREAAKAKAAAKAGLAKTGAAKDVAPANHPAKGPSPQNAGPGSEAPDGAAATPPSTPLREDPPSGGHHDGGEDSDSDRATVAADFSSLAAQLSAAASPGGRAVHRSPSRGSIFSQALSPRVGLRAAGLIDSDDDSDGAEAMDAVERLPPSLASPPASRRGSARPALGGGAATPVLARRRFSSSADVDGWGGAAAADQPPSPIVAPGAAAEAASAARSRRASRAQSLRSFVYGTPGSAAAAAEPASSAAAAAAAGADSPAAVEVRPISPVAAVVSRAAFKLMRKRREGIHSESAAGKAGGLASVVAAWMSSNVVTSPEHRLPEPAE
ncbi:hypothetical protein FNF29_00495 [Cafeteria roenbergensis]|uniref:FH2 domain-containing protein n=2 Tax=Cafeteria roenbergensis TaxID=33653 RepID=A0A5A8CVG2_CAFRO|nr:hypothetical protein FNF29_00495 [Cafeteria roenbergensis]|eukprot:KAA0157143.1 hypothetical protein FNF29_00495 [Cafeteria roenbergensis]